MDLFLQRCFDGFFGGAIYASLAIAIVMIFRSTGLLNFAQGEMAMVSGYVALVLLSPIGASIPGTGLANWLPFHPWPVGVAIVAAVVFGALLGAALERFVLRPLSSRNVLSQVNVTIGLLIVLNGFTQQMWGTGPRSLPSPFPNKAADYFSIGGARLRMTTLGVWLVLLAAIVILGVLLQRTKIGLAFRALTSNRESASLVGVPIERTLMIGWAMAAALGALSAALIGGALLLEPFLMIKTLIYALAAATIGGLDSPRGALVGGLIVGMSQSLVPGYTAVPTELSILPPLAVMILVLLVRPQGLFGTKPVFRA